MHQSKKVIAEPPPPPSPRPRRAPALTACVLPTGLLRGLRTEPPMGMSYKPKLITHMRAASFNAARSVHCPSTKSATPSQYHQLLSDEAQQSLGNTQGTRKSQVPQSKYSELLVTIEELGEKIRPNYARSKSAMERLKLGIIHSRGLVQECLNQTERNARS
nr:cyclin-dependent kinase 2-associated protein 1-like [Dasypus novemcinctus]